MASAAQESNVGEREIPTQQRAIEIFQSLGYRYLGNWADRPRNRNIESGMLAEWLRNRGYDDNLIGRALRSLDQASIISGSTTLYEANRAIQKTHGHIHAAVASESRQAQSRATVARTNATFVLLFL